MNDYLKLAALCKSVEDLVDNEPKSRSEISEWYKKAEQTKDLIAVIERSVEVPHFLRHYLDDADIRIRDPRYRAAQIEGVLQFLKEHGVKKDVGN
jgi:intein-encoded DNA endonuclease-like protein